MNATQKEAARDFATMIDDAHWLMDALREAIKIIDGLKRGDCWCEMAVGNPMVTKHSPTCRAAQAWWADDFPRS